MLRDGTFYQDLGADYFQKDTPYAQAKFDFPPAII
jgi:hypothetical protein